MERSLLYSLPGAALALLLAAACHSSTESIHLPPQPGEQVVQITLKKFEYGPGEVRVKKGVPVVLELTSLDRTHGFLLKAFKIDEDVKKGRITHIHFTPDRAGRFEFHCDVYCGDNHDDMEGVLVVEDA